jgi:hypothetical protein
MPAIPTSLLVMISVKICRLKYFLNVKKLYFVSLTLLNNKLVRLPQDIIYNLV